MGLRTGKYSYLLLLGVLSVVKSETRLVGTFNSRIN